MKDVSELKKSLCNVIDNNSEKIIKIAKDIGMNPELGFKEYETSEYIQKIFKELGLEFKAGLAITGVKAKLKKVSSDINIAILGELDGIPCPEHIYSNKTTGASHTCGHNLQIATLLGAAIGLKLSGIEDELGGDVIFFAVPAEEFIEIDFRENLRKEGKIHYLGGKQELIYLGEFDDIDISMMIHSMQNQPTPTIAISETGNGFIVKQIQYLGKGAHAGQAPNEGINALNAAMLGLMGINAIRDTFLDEDNIRVHPIITKGGTAVNIVPDDVRIDTYIRAGNVEAIDQTNLKVERALKGGAYSIGADINIKTIPGYLPLKCSNELNEILKENARTFENAKIINSGHFKASTDFGDICHLMPAVHPFIGGVEGALHTKDFKVKDYYSACLLPAKLLAMTAIDLLADNAKKAKDVLSKFNPDFTKEDYIKFMDKYFL